MLSAVDIQHVLLTQHQISISVRQLRRILSNRGLRRRTYDTPIEARQAIEVELGGSGANLGYRAMTIRLRHKHNINYPRDQVRKLLKEIDPEGVRLRRQHRLRRRSYYNRGPNYMIHIDGYDKLKPYGFAIHGAIDGYSRMILWLRVASTNNDPSVVANYFLDYLKTIEGVPRVVRTDAGTENTIIARIQKSFRWNHNDQFKGHKSVIVASSKGNQRIERWWGDLRKNSAQYWMNMFKDMEQLGVLSRANELHKELLRFCLMPIIQTELDRVKEEWNLHKIRPSKNLETVAGQPNNLYFIPSLQGTRNYRLNIQDLDEIEAIRQEYCKPPSGCDPNVKNAICLHMEENNIQVPTDATAALHLYGYLSDHVNEIRRLL